MHFDFVEEKIEQILNSPEKQKYFINEYKPLIAKELNIDEKDLIFKDIHRGSLGVSCIYLKRTEKTDISLLKLKGKYNIENIEEKPLLEALQISSNI